MLPQSILCTFFLVLQSTSANAVLPRKPQETTPSIPTPFEVLATPEIPIPTAELSHANANSIRSPKGGGGSGGGGGGGKGGSSGKSSGKGSKNSKNNKNKCCGDDDDDDENGRSNATATATGARSTTGSYSAVNTGSYKNYMSAGERVGVEWGVGASLIGAAVVAVVLG